MTRSGKALIAGAVLVPVLAAVYVRASVHVEPPTKTMVDVRRLREIVARPAATRELPMKDGAFDPYELVRRGIVSRDCFLSERSETGPTDEEIARGDYTNFPWERYRGDGNLKGSVPLPLLWDKALVVRTWGRGVIALADGSVHVCEHEEFLARVLAGLVVRSGRVPTKDGRFDPYQFARDGLIHRDFLRPAFEDRPTDAEIDRGEYENFPWERYGGDAESAGRPFALLRARAPNRDHDVFVAMSDGTIRRE